MLLTQKAPGMQIFAHDVPFFKPDRQRQGKTFGLFQTISLGRHLSGTGYRYLNWFWIETVLGQILHMHQSNPLR